MVLNHQLLRLRSLYLLGYAFDIFKAHVMIYWIRTTWPSTVHLEFKRFLSFLMNSVEIKSNEAMTYAL